VKRRRAIVGVVLLSFVLTGCGGSVSSGDRVLVAKYLYDSGLQDPERMDVVVFRFPQRPLERGVPTNYITRLLGLAGETIAIFFGQLFFTTDLSYPEDAEIADPLDLWQSQFMHRNDGRAKELFQQSKPGEQDEQNRRGFKIIRKSPETMLALRRPVFDNDNQPASLKKDLPPRWAAAKDGAAWKAEDGGKSFRHVGEGGGKGKEPEWLTYRHILRPLDWPEGKDRKHRPQLITDFSGYNSYELPRPNQPRANGVNWVGDLMLECEVEVEKASGELWMELACGVDIFRARWELETGRCTLYRGDSGGKFRELDHAMTRLGRAGTYQVRFANFDERLTVWVDRDLPFGDGKTYPQAWSFDFAKGPDKGHFVNVGPTANDLKPASIGSNGGAVHVRHLKLWRDTYYTEGNAADARLPNPQVPEELKDPLTLEDRKRRAALFAEHEADFWGSEHKWGPLRDLDVQTMYVQPGHYLCLGDNSPESSDSRAWGVVPQRLMLGRALVVYYPFNRAGMIR
jgi:hypothetical protein